MGIETYLEKTPFMPALDWVVNWGRKYSIWPVTFGLACCALEMMVTRIVLGHWLVLAQRFSGQPPGKQT